MGPGGCVLAEKTPRSRRFSSVARPEPRGRRTVREESPGRGAKNGGLAASAGVPPSNITPSAGPPNPPKVPPRRCKRAWTRRSGGPGAHRGQTGIMSRDSLDRSPSDSKVRDPTMLMKEDPVRSVVTSPYEEVPPPIRRIARVVCRSDEGVRRTACRVLIGVLLRPKNW